MKKIIFILVAALSLQPAFAQSEKYMKKMGELLPQADTLQDPSALENLANTFERVGEAEKTQWLPFYYAALCHVNAALFKGGSGGISVEATDAAGDKADALMVKALALTTDNSETWCLKKMIATMRMMADPMNRWAKYGPAATEALAKAKAMNAGNPRVYLLEGQDKFFTPEQFGGSKTEAKKLFEKAKELYAGFKPEGPLHPVWGMGTTMYFLAEASK